MPDGTQDAVNYAWRKGVVVVAAAGNDGTAAGAPANCANTIAVAATDAFDVRPSWSNHGTEVDLAAPGVDILAPVNPDKNHGAEYARMSGTSMAAPHVAGIAALLFNTAFDSSADSVRNRLFDRADRITGTGSAWTKGRVNAAAAVGGRVNWAAWRPAKQSTTFADASATRAVDDNTNGLWAGASLAHTSSNAQAWWRVDLQAKRSIAQVDVFNRTDCCGERLSNFVIETPNEDATWAVVGTVPGQAGAATSIPLPAGTAARYVHVRLRGTNYLALAEVQVWGK